MKQKLSNIKNKLITLWWFLTRKNCYLLSYNGRQSKFLESGKLVSFSLRFVKRRKLSITKEDALGRGNNELSESTNL